MTEYIPIEDLGKEVKRKQRAEKLNNLRVKVGHAAIWAGNTLKKTADVANTASKSPLGKRLTLMAQAQNKSYKKSKKKNTPQFGFGGMRF